MIKNIKGNNDFWMFDYNTDLIQEKAFLKDYYSPSRSSNKLNNLQKCDLFNLNSNLINFKALW